MFNGQNFLNGLAQGPFGGSSASQPGMSSGGPSGPAMSFPGPGNSNATGAAIPPGATLSNPQLQALMQQQQMQQMRWQQIPQQQQQQESQSSGRPPAAPQQQQVQQNEGQQQPRPPSQAPQQQFFNPSAFLQQATAGNAMLSQPGPSSGIQTPDTSVTGQPQQHTGNPMLQSSGINPALMASMGSLNPQQLHALLTASSQPLPSGSLNPSAFLGGGTLGSAAMQGNPSVVTSMPGGTPDPNAMLQQMQAMGAAGPSHMNPFMNMAQGMGFNSSMNITPGMTGSPMVAQPPHPNGSAGGLTFPPPPPPPQQQRPSTAKSAASQGDGPGTPDVKGAVPPRGGKQGRKPRGSVKPEATPTPTMSAATMGTGAAASPPHVPTGLETGHHRSPSVSGMRPPPPVMPPQPAQPPLHSDLPPNWRPHLSVQQQQDVMAKALEYAKSKQMNPGEVLDRMNLMYVKAESLPGGGNGYAMPNGAVVINFDEARMLGLPRPGHPAPPPTASGATMPPSAGMPNHVASPAAGSFVPPSPAAGGFPMGQPQMNPGGLRQRQPSTAGSRPDPRQGFPTGAMGPPPIGPGHLSRTPSGMIDTDPRQASIDSPGSFPRGIDSPGHLRRASETPNLSHPVPPGMPFGFSSALLPRPASDLPPVNGGALPATTKQGRPITGMNTRFTPLPNFDRPSLSEEDLSGNSWEPMSKADEHRLLKIMQTDADYEASVKEDTQQMHAAIRARVEEMRPLKRRTSNAELVAPEHLHWWERAGDEEPVPVGREGHFRIVFPEEKKLEVREKRGGRTATTGQQFERLRKKQLAAVGEQSEDLVPIRLEIDHEGWKLRDTFTWNASDGLTSYDEFSRNLCEDFGLPEFSFVPLIRESLSLQIQEHLQSKMLMPQDESATKAGACGILSLEDEKWWGQWRDAVEAFENAAWAGEEKPVLPVVEDGVLSVADLRRIVSSANAAASLKIQVKLDITVGAMNLLDQFEWDILDEKSNPEEFASLFAADLGLAGEFKTAIAHSIREQVHVHLRSLVLVGHPFDGSHVTDEEMRGAFLPESSELVSVTRNAQEVDDYTPKLVQLSEAEVDRQERERERESKRKRRQTRGRRGVNMPDRDPLKTQRTPAICGLQATQIEAAGGIAAVAAAAGASVVTSSDFPGVRTSTRRAAAAANASFHAQSDFDTPTPAPEPRPSVGPTSAKRRRLEDYSVYFKYPGGLGREDAGSPKFAPSSQGADSETRPASTAAALPSSTGAGLPAHQAPSPSKESRTATTASSSASTPKVSRPEDVANQHPNIVDGQWYCSNCGIPGWLTLGRRKGPLGEKTLCGPCGKFWHRFRRMKQVEYTRDEAHHKKNGSAAGGLQVNGFPLDDDSSALATGDNTPSREFRARSPFARRGGGKNEDQSSTRGTTPDLPFQRVGSPSDSESDWSQSPRPSRRPSPRKAGGGVDGIDNGIAASTRPRNASPGKPDALPSFKRRDSVLAAQAAAAAAAVAKSSASPAPTAARANSPAAIAAPGAVNHTPTLTRPTPPVWLKSSAEVLRAKYPHDRFELRPKGVGEWRIRCLDCPGKLYNPGPGETLTNFEIHLKNRAHRANVATRLEKGGEGSDVGAVITAASPM